MAHTSLSNSIKGVAPFIAGFCNVWVLASPQSLNETDPVPNGLKRYQHEHDLHVITFSWYRRQPYLSEPGAYTTLEQALEQTRRRHSMQVHG